MKLPKNHLKKALSEGKTQIGIWSSLKSPMVAEALSLTAFDWMVIDMEHGLNDLGDVVAQLQAMSDGQVAPAVRPAWNDFVTIKRLLDAGVQTLVIPFVQNAEEARAAVSATRYPPNGIRGVAGGSRATKFGRVENYFAAADGEICIIVQVETAEAVDEIEEIAAVDGVDVIFIGPADLAASMGHLGNTAHPDVMAKFAEAQKRIEAAGAVPGILSFDPDQAQAFLDMGYRFVAVGSDQSLLSIGAKLVSDRFLPDSKA